MLTYARWKYVVLVLVVLLSALYALPNVFPQDPSVQISANRGGKIDAALVTRVRDALGRTGVSPKAVEQDADDVLVRLGNADQQVRAADALRDALGNDYVVALNLAATVPSWLEMTGARAMKLGLDLQGGVHFLLQIDQQAAMDKRVDALAEDVRVQLRDARIPYRSVERRQGAEVMAVLASPADAARARETLLRGQTGLELDGTGNTLVLRLTQAELQRTALDAVEQNVSTLRNRVNQLKVAEPVIQRQGTDRVIVELPGIQDTAQAKRVIGATATLEYRAVAEGDAQSAVETGVVPPDARVYYEVGPGGERVPRLLSKRVIATGDQLVDARASRDEQGRPAVSVRLNSAGGQRMFDFTSENVGKPMAVVLIERIPEVRNVGGQEVKTTRINEEIISVATINGVFSRDFQTTGLDSPQFASDLALQLRSGSLAAPMDFVEERIVGPSLGRQNIERGLQAVIFSFAFTLVFFLVYYRMFGLVTCLALLLNLLALVAVMSLIGATLSLPGLAGIALTVGMSVDANVLINERIREELRAGMPPQSAIATGYDKAAGTIADANITAILAGVALFAFGTGPVQGFAVALIVGIVTSMYTAVSASRAIATLIYGRRRRLQSIAI